MTRVFAAAWLSLSLAPFASADDLTLLAQDDSAVLLAQAEQTRCTTQYDPVCGANGTTYTNACVAGLAGVEVASEGACPTGEMISTAGMVSVTVSS